MRSHGMLSRGGTSPMGLQGQLMAQRVVLPAVRSVSREGPSTSTTTSSTNIDFDVTKYRRNVGICVVNRKTGDVFAAQRSDSGCNSWQMPQGGIDEGEEAETAALRELEEETCIRPTSVRVVASMDRWLTYDFPTQVRARLHGGWEKYQGQAQKWFLVVFDGDDSEINLETEHKEFKEWQWMQLQDLPTSVVEFKKGVYVQVAAAFVPRIEEMRRQGEVASSSSNGR